MPVGLKQRAGVRRWSYFE